MAATSVRRTLDRCAHSALSEATASETPGETSAGRLRVGVDLVVVSEVLDSARTFGARYRDRIYTDGELEECGDGCEPVSASRLAARFAAKEAVTKVLAPPDAPGWWRDIETVRAASGACQLRLRGTAAGAAERAGLSGWALSLTHEGDYAAAVVISMQSAPAPGVAA